MTLPRILRSMVPCLVLTLALAWVPRAHAETSRPGSEIDACMLNVTVTGCGTIVRRPDPPPCGTVEVYVFPCDGSQFIGWSGDVSGSANPLTFTLDGNKSITANFAPNTWEIKFEPKPRYAYALALVLVWTILLLQKESPFLYFQF